MESIRSSLTIKEIGTFRFYKGIVLGIGYSLIFNSLLRLIIRLNNVKVTVFTNTIINTYEFTVYYLILAAITAISFGFCITTYIWLSNPFASTKNKTRRIRSSQTNTIVILYVVLLFLARMQTFFMDTAIVLQRDFGNIAFLLPVFVYLYCWNMIARVYRYLKSFIIITIVLVLLSIVLSHI